MRPSLVQTSPIRLKPDRFEALISAHEAFVAGRRGGRRAAFKFIVAAGYNCDRRVLAEGRFDGADFRGTSFVETDFSRASLFCANLSKCDFRRARMKRADLRGATLSGANLAGANLDGADLRAAVLFASDDINGIRWVGGRTGVGDASPNNTDLGEAVAHSVDFSNCSLQGASLRDANMKNADFSGANLSGADLGGARLEGARFLGAILSGIDVTRLAIGPTVLKGCVLDPSQEARARVDEVERELDRAHDWVATQGRPANLEGFDLRPASHLFRERLLAGLQAKAAMAIGVDFTGTQLQGANFEGADLRAANFTGADLRGVSFVNANLAHAVFDRADLSELDLHSGLKLATRFDGAVLDGCGLKAA
ncbi:pentapeptide repeat-containing protein [Phenylobacterium sp.]|uniref:pentapeptide repeat-containing protein n=1 Tax=Phenylobacterium sp. TaxID=1871053 RepID=UPI0035616395